jgi:H+/Cl- antiporter ClcA
MRNTRSRDLVSIGAAAGFAAALGGPTGGLFFFFFMEEASRSLDHSVLFRTSVGAGIATFFLAVSQGDLSDYCIINLVASKLPIGTARLYAWSIFQLVFCMILVGGSRMI